MDGTDNTARKHSFSLHTTSIGLGSSLVPSSPPPPVAAAAADDLPLVLARFFFVAFLFFFPSSASFASDARRSAALALALALLHHEHQNVQTIVGLRLGGQLTYLSSSFCRTELAKISLSANGNGTSNEEEKKMFY